MNSINWARVMAQVVYYVTTVARLGRCSFAVPSGNFGNIFSGWIAERMGLPIDQLVIGSNSNDILTRWAPTGRSSPSRSSRRYSPSMDIQVSSNHERLLFELGGRDGAAHRRAPRPVPRASARWRRRTTTASRRPPSTTPTTLAVIRDVHDAHRRARRPAHGGGHRRRPRLPRRRRPDGRPGHGPPGQVPRRRRAGHRHPAPAPAAAGRPVRAGRAVRRAPERRRGRAGPRPRRPSADRPVIWAGICPLAANLPAGGP